MDEKVKASEDIGKVDKEGDKRTEEEMKGWRPERRNEKRRRDTGWRWGERGGMGAVEMGKRSGRKRRGARVGVNNERGEE